MPHLVQDIGVAIIVSTIIGVLAHLLRQPIILGFLLAGILIGPKAGYGLIADADDVEIISEIGLILLLFIVGLEVNIKLLFSSGRSLLFGGFGQFPVCVALGILTFGALGFGLTGGDVRGLYFALLCALSSTAIVVKALDDKHEFETLPGKLTLGILVVQDIYAILILAIQPNISKPSFGPIALAIGGSAFLVALGFTVSRYLLGPLFHRVAKSPEMVLSISIAWCAIMAGLADVLQLSNEMGALIAGLSISAFPYSVHVTAKTLPLRDFFLTLFFVSLGMKIDPPTMQLVQPVLFVSGFIIASRFLSIYPLLTLAGAGRRAAFVCSLNLAQLSEFSLVIGSIGVTLGHIPESMMSILIIALVVLSVLSSYAIRYNHELYLAFSRQLDKISPEKAAIEHGHIPEQRRFEIVFLGYHRGARALLESIASHHAELIPHILVIDFNPEVLVELKDRGVEALFGDLASMDTLKHAELQRAKIVLSTIPDMLLKGTDNRSLVRMVRSIAPKAWMVATADDSPHEQELRREGVDLAIRPFDLMGEWLAAFVRQTVNHEEAARQTVAHVVSSGRWIAPAIAFQQPPQGAQRSRFSAWRAKRTAQ
ncbi:MAG: cation:proton antiporter [Bdellovibrionota bacterium]